MLSRIYWQEDRFGRNFFELQPRTASKRKHASQRGWFTIVAISATFMAWLLYRWRAAPAWLTILPDEIEGLLGLMEIAGAIALAVVWAGLFWRQNSLPQRANSLIGRNTLYQLSPADFERFVARVFEQKGYYVEHRGRSGDHGVDLVLHRQDGRKAIVQCKRYRRTVGEEVVRELMGTLIHERSNWGFLVTTAEISEAAHAWSQGKPLTLIDGQSLAEIATGFDLQLD